MDLEDLDFLLDQLHPCLLSTRAFREIQEVQVFQWHQVILEALLFHQFLSIPVGQMDLLFLAHLWVLLVPKVLVVPSDLVNLLLLFHQALPRFP